MTGVAGGDIPTIELTAADVGDIDDDEDVFFAAAADGRALEPLSEDNKRVFVADFSATDRLDFELASVIDEHTLSSSPARFLTPSSTSDDKCCLEAECEMGDSCEGNGGGWAFVAGTSLSAGFMGEDAADDLVGDGVPTWLVCGENPPSVRCGLSGVLFCDFLASSPRPSTHVGFDEVFMCLDPVVLSCRLRLPDHRSTDST